VTFLFSTAGAVLGGAYFPLDVMPEWLQKLAQFVPITHSLHALRLAMLQGHSIAMIWPSLGILAVMAAVLLPTGLWMFSRAIDKGRRDGTLVQY